MYKFQNYYENISPALRANYQGLARGICNYNGHKGTEKQVDKCLKCFSGQFDLMLRFKENRF